MLETERRGDVALLRLAHGKASALDRELLERLTAALDEAEAAGARAVVLTGTGTIFSAGVDLFRVLDGGPAYVESFLPVLDRALLRLLTFPRPTVAAVNGHAIAGGCILALACDRRLAARGPGRIGVPELLVGVPFPPLPLEIVREAVPAAHLAEVVYGAATYLPEEALERGLIQEVVAPEHLLDRALTYAETLAARPPDAFALTKSQLLAPLLARVAAAQPCLDQVRAVWSAPETHQRIREYLARTVGQKR
jgi:enoyl-CoA hydratase